MSNLDKDIEILEELAEDTIRYKMVETDAYMAGAITRVLSELKTYKKIAEFMADFINMYTLSGEENQYCHRVIDCQEIGGSRSCIECIIDWARKEVENEKNNSNT